MSKAIYLDFGRCIYCRACEVACEREHDGLKSIFVVLRERFAVPLDCRHCEKSPCLAICYTQALTRSPEGAVVLDVTKCTGCKLCVFACPFGLISFDSVNKVVAKCDLCLRRIEEGKEPACVSTCLTRALYYGEYETFMERLRKRSALILGRSLLVRR
jgi:formate dehydrogenase iron-sulfur subunit